MHELASDMKRNAESIAKQTLTDWDELAEREPWHGLPPSLDMDHLPDLIVRLTDAALSTMFGYDERIALAKDAVRHGEHRFSEGVSEEILQREYELLRWSLWQRLKRTAPPDQASEAIIRLDSGMTFALGATLRGYHRRIIEETGDWPGTLDRYIDGWSFPAG